jgi:hypothetical protein
MNNEKSVYISGPLTGLPQKQQKCIRDFYERIAGLVERISGVRAFIPHEYFDPVHQPDATPEEVNRAERQQICERTSLLLVVAVAPSWGGGIEVEIANQNNISAIILCRHEDLESRTISRLLLGNPAVVAVIDYKTPEEALEKLEQALKSRIA